MLLHDYMEFYYRNAIFMEHDSIDVRSVNMLDFFFLFFIIKNTLKMIFQTLLVKVYKCSILGKIFFKLKSKSDTWDHLV